MSARDGLPSALLTIHLCRARFGCIVDTAENGAVAVEKIVARKGDDEEPAFAIVFLDNQVSSLLFAFDRSLTLGCRCPSSPAFKPFSSFVRFAARVTSWSDALQSELHPSGALIRASLTSLLL